MNNMIVDNAKVMSKGQITLPKEIRNKLGLTTGDRVTLICEGDQVVMMNAAVYAMKMLQKGMEGQAYSAELVTENAINELVAEVRGEVEGLSLTGVSPVSSGGATESPPSTATSAITWRFLRRILQLVPSVAAL